MKILYILKKEYWKSDTGRKIMERHATTQDVTVVKLSEKSASELLDLIESHDKLIMC